MSLAPWLLTVVDFDVGYHERLVVTNAVALLGRVYHIDVRVSSRNLDSVELWSITLRGRVCPKLRTSSSGEALCSLSFPGHPSTVRLGHRNNCRCH